MSTPIDPGYFRQVLGQYPTGVVVVTALDPDGDPLGMTVGTFSSVSLDPPLVAFMPDKKSSSWKALRASGERFCINILGDHQEDVCRLIATRKQNKFEGIDWRLSAGGAPVISGSVAHIDCTVEDIHGAGDHDIVLGRVHEMAIENSAFPLLFFRGGYGSFRPLSLAAADADLLDQLRLVDLVRPHMEALAARFSTEVTAISLVRGELVLTAAAGRAQTAQAPTRVGQRVPFLPPLGAAFAAWGGDKIEQCWLAGLDGSVPAELAAWYRDAPGRVRARGYSIALGHEDSARLETVSTQLNAHDPEVSLDTLLAVMKAASYGYNVGELDPGSAHELRSLSAPVFGPAGEVALTLTFWGPPGTVTTEQIDEFAHHLGLITAAATAAIGALPPQHPPPRPQECPMSTQHTNDADVIVVGGGNAGFAAALAAAERGRSVLLLEKAPLEEAGGNSFYTAGATRIAHHGLAELADLLEPDDRFAATTLPPYPAEDFAADVAKVTEGRNDPELTAVMVAESQSTLRWLKGLGMRYRLLYERQAYELTDGTFLFWGGLHVGNVDGGAGMLADYVRVATGLGVQIRYGQAVSSLLTDGGKVTGVVIDDGAGTTELHAESVILAAGGYHANPAWRREHLGEGWENAKVRGTPYSTGDMIRAGIQAGAALAGDWETAHSVQLDAFHPHNESNRDYTNRLARLGYPLGIVVNQDGERFFDEGADFRNYTYARLGKEVLRQPGSVAYQIFDATMYPRLDASQYQMPGVSMATAGSVPELAAAVGIDVDGLARTVRKFNASIDDGGAGFDPTIKDGRRAAVEPPKSNWAVPLATGPFYAFPVTCGITFTYGGLKSDAHGRVLANDGAAIDGLYVTGEMLGGLFWGNYPGGSGLTAGMVFGRRAGLLA